MKMEKKKIMPQRLRAAAILAAVLSLHTAADAGKVLKFNGTSAYVDTAYAFDGLSSYTLEAWIRTAAIPASGKYGGIAGNGFLGGDIDGFGLFASYTGVISFGLRQKTPNLGVSVSTPYDFSNAWHHVAGVYDKSAGQIRIYLDGAQMGVLTTNVNIGPITFPFLIGARKTSSLDHYFNGNVSEVRLWNHARSGAAVQATKDRRLGGDETGLIGYWPLNEGSGTNAYDLVVGAGRHNGIIINSSWVDAAGLDSLLADPEYRAIMPFDLANVITGSRVFTGTNEVGIVIQNIPAGFDKVQFEVSGCTSGLSVNGWADVDGMPSTFLFAPPVADTNLVLYAWFTNTAASVAMQRSTASIIYTRAAPQPSIVVAHTCARFGTNLVVVQTAEFDNGSGGGITGGTTGNVEIPLYARKLRRVSGPGPDYTPELDSAALFEDGEYELELIVQNAAGNVATSAVSTVTVVLLYDNKFAWKGGDGDWHAATNWNLGYVPCDDAEVTIASGTVLLAKSTARLAKLTMNGGLLKFDGWETRMTAADVLLSSGKVTHVANTAENAPWEPNARVWVKCDRFALEAAAQIDMLAKGYRGGDTSKDGKGPGGGFNNDTGAGGGSYGGKAGVAYVSNMEGAIYGEAAAPDLPGSGGAGGGYNGLGGHGGGALRLEVSGMARVDGLIDANAGKARYERGGGGSGGAIWITCGTLTGTGGVIRAEGSTSINSNAAGGGGGRIAVEITDVLAQAALAPHRVSMSTYPNADYAAKQGDIGTIYLSDDVLLDGAWLPHHGRFLLADKDEWESASLNVTGWCRFVPRSKDYFTLHSSGDATIAGALAHLHVRGPEVVVEGNMMVNDGAKVTFSALPTSVPAVVTNANGLLSVAGELNIGDNSWIFPVSDPVSGSYIHMSAGSLVIATSGGINANNRGYQRGINLDGTANGYGPGGGKSSSLNGSGGGYGGRGGRSENQGARGAAYGVPLQPLQPGSGGAGRTGAANMAGGNGGGMIRLAIDGEAAIDGILYANGQNGVHHGGGSGGGIYLECRKLKTSATTIFTANGGNGKTDKDGGGGGGRIAVWHGLRFLPGISTNRLQIAESVPEEFAGAFSVTNGSGYVSQTAYSEPGTIRFVRVMAPFGTVLTIR